MGGGVFLREDYQFSGSFFSAEEMHHIVLALRIADSFSVTQRKDAILQKLCLLDPDLVTLLEQDAQTYLSLDLLERPVDTNNEVCQSINHCLEEEVLCDIDEQRAVACLEYVLKPDGLYLYAHASDYLLLRVDDITHIDVREEEFERNFLPYMDWKQA